MGQGPYLDAEGNSLPASRPIAQASLSAKAESGHQVDEDSGFGETVLGMLSKLGYSNLRHAYSGGRARLYLGETTGGRPVAIRVQARFALQRRRNQATRKNILRLKALECFLPRHPNLVRHLDSGVLRVPRTDGAGEDRILYAVMNLVSGVTLEAALGDPAFVSGGVPRLEATIRGILEGLSALYKRGIRQGDLGPPNVMLESKTWNPVLIDLRFSLRFFRRADRDRHDLRRTLRCLLTCNGKMEDQEPLPPLSAERAVEIWGGKDPATQAKVREWAAFAESLAPGGNLGSASLPRILARACELAAS